MFQSVNQRDWKERVLENKKYLGVFPELKRLLPLFWVLVTMCHG